MTFCRLVADWITVKHCKTEFMVEEETLAKSLAAHLENAIVPPKATESFCEPFCETEHDKICHLHGFEENAILEASSKIQSNLKSRAQALIHVGVAKNHAKDCFAFLNKKTEKFAKSGDANLWTNQMDDKCRVQSPHAQQAAAAEMRLEKSSESF